MRKVYLETSVIGYLAARPSRTILGAAHQEITLAWWDLRHRYDVVISEAVARECEAGDPEAAARRLTVVAQLPMLRINERCIALAQGWIGNGILPTKAAEDALHIAIATLHGVDYLLTWNCRHIANPEIQRGLSVDLDRKNLFLPFICTPEELLGGDDDDVE
jgi:predicted nucleic acid-binding protein